MEVVIVFQVYSLLFLWTLNGKATSQVSESTTMNCNYEMVFGKAVTNFNYGYCHLSGLLSSGTVLLSFFLEVAFLTL